MCATKGSMEEKTGVSCDKRVNRYLLLELLLQHLLEGSSILLEALDTLGQLKGIRVRTCSWRRALLKTHLVVGHLVVLQFGHELLLVIDVADLVDRSSISGFGFELLGNGLGGVSQF